MGERSTDEDALEAAYWRFDALQGRQGGERKLQPMSERDAFKAAVRELLAARKERAGG